MTEFGSLPYIDEHGVDVEATPEAAWHATLCTIRQTFSGRGTERAARLLGCADVAWSDWSGPAAGDALPGFRIVQVASPNLITLAGRHRFADYALTFRIDETSHGTRCRAESRARFPGLRGRLYRTAVIDSRGHRVLVRRLLRSIKRRAETG